MVVTLLLLCHDLLGIAVLMPAKSEVCSYEAKTASVNEAKAASLPQAEPKSCQVARVPGAQGVCRHITKWW